MKPPILFIYFLPHPAHKYFANSIGAEPWYYYKYFNHRLVPRLCKSFLNGLLLPRRDVYFCEGGAPLAPAVVRKILSGGTIIGLFADCTYMEKTRNIFGKLTWLIEWIHKIESHFIDGAIAVSLLAKQGAEDYMNIPIRICYPFIQDDRYTEFTQLQPDLNSNYILSIGNMEPYKGMDILLEAFKLVRKEIHDAELHLLGIDYPEEWNTIPGVSIEGYVKDLLPYMSRASLFVQSARTDSFPVATLESLYAGIPTIVTEGTGTREVVEHLGKQFVVKTDTEDVAKAIINYLRLPISTRRKLSITAKSISKKFNRQEMCDLFKREFTLLLNDISLKDNDGR
jgi:glycosyltransferase involved in cell wall biosynthesis